MTDYRQLFENYLEEQRFDGSLGPAIDYVIRNGGNRIRPQLVLAWCDACGGQVEDTLPLALAVECVHTMSLVHDDLPCMDNSNERRGKPCLHVAMDEQTAVLCGDKLLAYAFNIVTNADYDDEQIISALYVLSKVACNMADGQHLELVSEETTVEKWTEIHEGKTASLLECACVLGVIAANGCESQLIKAKTYGRSLGLGYQLLDDTRDNDGISTKLDTNDIEQLMATYSTGCYMGMEAEAYQFLTEFARKVLS